MPTVNRAAPPSRPVPKRPPAPPGGGLLSSAIEIGELPESPIHMTLYGRNGVGKTTLACKFPKPLLLIAVEYAKTGGADSVKREAGVKYLRLKTVDEVERVGRELRNDTQFASVVLDSGTSLEEIVLAKIVGWDKPANMLRFGNVTQQQYMERSDLMRQLLEPLLTLDKHVVMICNEKDHNPRKEEGTARKSAVVKSREITDESFFAPALGGGTARWCMDACDWICQLYVDKEIKTTRRTVGEGKTAKEVETHTETGRVVRRLRLKYHPNFASRVRCPNAETLPDYLEEPTFDQILAAFRGQ